MFVKAVCICIGCIVIIAFYNGWLCLIVAVGVLPQILVTRWSAHYLNTFYVRYQKEKGEMSHLGKESISDIRTVKAFANEEMTTLRFASKNQSVFEYGRSKGYIWGIYFIGYRTMASLTDLGIIWIVARWYEDFNLTLGEVTAVMLYVRTLMNHSGSITNNI